MCKFDIATSATADQVVDKARELITGSGGTFDGNPVQGNYTVKLPLGSVQGTYTINGSTVAFHITKKPMVMPCSAIQLFLESKLAG